MAWPRPTFRPELEAAFIESERQALLHQHHQQQHGNMRGPQFMHHPETQWGREFEQHMRHGPPPPGAAHALMVRPFSLL